MWLKNNWIKFDSYEHLALLKVISIILKKEKLYSIDVDSGIGWPRWIIETMNTTRIYMVWIIVTMGYVEEYIMSAIRDLETLQS